MNDAFFMIMWRRRNLLLLFLLGGALCGALLIWVLPKQYTVTNGFRIGQFMGVPLELAEFTSQRFKQVGFIADAYEAANLMLPIPRDQYPKTVKVSIENDFNKQSNIDTVIFSTTAETPQLAHAMSMALGRHLVAVHGRKLEDARALRRQEIRDWQDDIHETGINIKSMEERLQTMGSGNRINDAAVFLTTAKLEEQQSLLFHMKEKMHHITFKIDNPVESFDTEIISQPRIPERASFPQIPLILAGMVFLSGLAWIFFCWASLQVETVLAGKEYSRAGHNSSLENETIEGPKLVAGNELRKAE